MATPSYSADFYSIRRDGSTRSALRILPIVFDMIKPASVVDVGCGVGTWLSVAKRLGGPIRVVGYEGPWITGVSKPDPSIEIRVADLEGDLIDVERFDVAMCMEVAEHLSAKRASSLIRDLCNLSDCVLFSAAIPGQGGQSHVNEQWQSYWLKLFDSMDYAAFDIIRPVVWENEEVDFWYRQNSFLYIKRSKLASLRLTETRLGLVDVAHPIIVESKTRKERPTIRESLRKAASAVRRLGVRTKVRNAVRKFVSY